MPSRDPVYSLALISRPVHVLVIAEYIRLKEGEKFIVLVDGNQQAPERQAIQMMLFSIKRKNTKVIFSSGIFKSEGANVLVFYIKTLWRRLYVGRLNEILLSGGVKSRILYKLLKFRKTILIDEGSSSLWKFPNAIKYGQPFMEATRFGQLYKRFGVNKLPRKSPFVLYTMYYQSLPTLPYIIANKLSYWKELAKDYAVSPGRALVLGTTYHKYDLKAEEYQTVLSKVIDEIKASSIQYKFHKKERRFSLTLRNVSIIETDLPVEFYFMQQKSFPEFLVGVNSTALRIIELIKPEVKLINIELKAPAN